MTDRKFKVFVNELTDGSIVFNVMGTADGTRITLGAASAQNAHAIADSINDAAWIETDQEAEPEAGHTLELSDRRVIVRRRDVYGVAKFYPMNDNARMIAELAGTKTLTPAAIALAQRLGFRLVATADEFPPADIPPRIYVMGPRD